MELKKNCLVKKIKSELEIVEPRYKICVQKNFRDDANYYEGYIDALKLVLKFIKQCGESDA